MYPAAKRELLLTLLCALILLCLIDYRYNVSTRIIGDSSNTLWSGTASSSLDEFGELVEPEPVDVRPKAIVKSQRHKASFGNPAIGKHHRHGPSRIEPPRLNMTPTKLLKHTPGWTALDTVYLFNSTLYLVRSDAFPVRFPEFRMMLSGTSTKMEVISASQARQLFGDQAAVIDGTSFLYNESDDHVSDDYDFLVHVLPDFWRTYTSLDSPSTSTEIPAPMRFMLPNTRRSNTTAGLGRLSRYVFQAAFPSTALEFADIWDDRVESQKVFVMQRVVIGDRLAAGTASLKGEERRTYDSREGWWEPVRQNVIQFAGMMEMPKVPVITYIARQPSGRRVLSDDDHNKLVHSLEGIRKRHGWKLNVVEDIDSLGYDAQIALAAQSTILIGLRGTGLAASLWMRPTQQATVVEFFPATDILKDLGYTTRLLGLQHYGIWNDTLWTFPQSGHKRDGIPRELLKRPRHTDGISVDADLVAELCVRQLQLPVARP